MEEKKNSSFTLTIVIVISIAAFIAVLIYSEYDRRGIKESQDLYQSKIDAIKQAVDSGECSDASSLYTDAKAFRDKIIKSGLYYSLEPYAKQAHAIEIAECFANNDKFAEAVAMIEAEEVHDPDYLSRASAIYERAGDVVKAEEAKSMAEKYDH